MTKTLSTTEFGRTLDPPMDRTVVYRLCEQGLVEGAEKVEGEWRIPPGASVRLSGRRRYMHTPLTGYSAAEFARRHAVSRQAVYRRLWNRQIEGATKTEDGWDIPRDAQWSKKAGRGKAR